MNVLLDDSILSKNVDDVEIIVLKSPECTNKVNMLVNCCICYASFSSSSSLNEHRNSHHFELLDHLPFTKRNKYRQIGATDYAVNRILQEHLPQGYDYEVTHFEDSGGGHFEAKFSFKINAVSEWQTFLEAYKSMNNERFRLANTKNNCGPTLILRGYHCHYNAQKKHGRNRKNLDCPAKFSIVVRKKQSSNEFLCSVSISFCHNHATEVPEAVRKLEPCPEVVAKFEDLFRQGLAPSAALASHEKDMQELYGDKFKSVVHNRRLCPDIQWVYKHYYAFYRNLSNEPLQPVMLKALEPLMSELRLLTKDDNCINVMEHGEGTFTVVIVSPLMRRVGTTVLARDVCYFEATRGLDLHDCRVFIMSCRTAAGCLPLSIVVANSDSDAAVTEGLHFHLSMLDDGSFGGKGATGPNDIECISSEVEKQYLKAIYPLSNVSISCIFVLDDIWSWLYRESGIPNEDKISLYIQSKKVIYSLDKINLRSNFMKTVQSPLFCKYSGYRKYFSKWFFRNSEWAPCLKLQPYVPFNVIDGCIFVLKDQILDRHRIYSPLQLIRLLTLDISNYFEAKVKMIATEGKIKETKRKSTVGSKYLVLKMLNDCFCEVLDSKTNELFLINTDLCLCTCQGGGYRKLCKHFEFYKKRTVDSRTQSLVDLERQKDDLYYIATGERVVRNESLVLDLIGENEETTLMNEDVAMECVLPYSLDGEDTV